MNTNPRTELQCNALFRTILPQFLFSSAVPCLLARFVSSIVSPPHASLTAPVIYAESSKRLGHALQPRVAVTWTPKILPWSDGCLPSPEVLFSPWFGPVPSWRSLDLYSKPYWMFFNTLVPGNYVKRKRTRTLSLARLPFKPFFTLPSCCWTLLSISLFRSTGLGMAIRQNKQGGSNLLNLYLWAF